MVRYCALASGSNGNSYFIEKGDTAILVDVGISCKQLQMRMRERNIEPDAIAGVFITHEHTDHIKGLSVFVRRYRIPVYLTRGTYAGMRCDLPPELLRFIEVNDKTTVGGLQIYSVPKYHDAGEPCSFFISDGKSNIAVLTDIGRICDNVKRAIANSDVLILEANYDDQLLTSGRYPTFLKNRISGGWGHLSNVVALDAYLQHRSTRLKHLILGHLSAENNSEERVRSLFEPHCQSGTQLSIAKRTEATEMFHFGPAKVNLQTSLFAESDF